MVINAIKSKNTAFPLAAPLGYVCTVRGRHIKGVCVSTRVKISYRLGGEIRGEFRGGGNS